MDNLKVDYKTPILEFKRKFNKLIDSSVIEQGESENTIIQKVGNPEEAEIPPAENEASQWWSAAFGKSNKATNYASFVCGTRNENNGDSAFVAGVGNKTTSDGMCSLTFGERNKNQSRDSLVGGYLTECDNTVSQGLFVGTLIKGDENTQNVIGTANAIGGNNIHTGIRFCVGSGGYDLDPETGEPTNIQRKNAFVVFKDGHVYIENGLVASIKDGNLTERISVNTAGQAVFTSHILPDNNNTRTIGTAAKGWKSIYLKGSLLKDDTEGNSVSIDDLIALVAYAKQQGWIS